MASNGADGSNGGYATGTGAEKIQTDIITLSRFLTEEQTKHKEATGDFTYVWTRSHGHGIDLKQTPVPDLAILL